MTVCKNIDELIELVRRWKSAGEKIVLTNGVFDILHLGHVDYLEKAKALGDRLVVAVNSDSSVKQLGKGDERPINPEFARAKVISSLRCVDASLVFSESTPLKVITQIQPDILVKGGDYDPVESDSSKKTYIVGSAEVKSAGGRIVAIPLVSGYSTTSILKKLNK